MDSYSTKKEQNFAFLQKVLGIHFLTLRSMILRGVCFYQYLEYLSEILSKTENILTHWSVVQGGTIKTGLSL